MPRSSMPLAVVDEAQVISTSDFRAHLLGGPKIDDFEIERDSSHARTVDL